MRRGILPPSTDQPRRSDWPIGLLYPTCLPGAPSTDRVTRQGASPGAGSCQLFDGRHVGETEANRSGHIHWLLTAHHGDQVSSRGRGFPQVFQALEVEGIHRLSTGPPRSRVSTGFSTGPPGHPGHPEPAGMPEAVGTRPSPTHASVGGQWPPTAYSSADSRTPIPEPTTSFAATTPAPRRQARAPAPGDRLQHQSRARGSRVARGLPPKCTFRDSRPDNFQKTGVCSVDGLDPHRGRRGGAGVNGQAKVSTGGQLMIAHRGSRVHEATARRSRSRCSPVPDTSGSGTRTIGPHWMAGSAPVRTRLTAPSGRRVWDTCVRRLRPPDPPSTATRSIVTQLLAARRQL